MYAHVKRNSPESADGIVFELIEPYFYQESDRPAAPEPLSGDAGELATELHNALLAAHDNFPIGQEVPIEDRFPADMVQDIHVCGEDVRQGDSYANGVFGPAPEPAAPTVEEITRERAGRLAEATSHINPLQDLVDLGEANAEDEAQLLAWRKYRAAVYKVDPQADDIVWPTAPGV